MGASAACPPLPFGTGPFGLMFVEVDISIGEKRVSLADVGDEDMCEDGSPEVLVW